MKTKSSRRYYRPDDVAILELIKELLYERRYTIEGVQKLFKNRTTKDILGTEIQKDFFEEIESSIPQADNSVSDVIATAIKDLSKLKEELKNLIKE